MKRDDSNLNIYEHEFLEWREQLKSNVYNGVLATDQKPSSVSSKSIFFIVTSSKT